VIFEASNSFPKEETYSLTDSSGRTFNLSDSGIHGGNGSDTFNVPPQTNLLKTMPTCGQAAGILSARLRDGGKNLACPQEFRARAAGIREPLVPPMSEVTRILSAIEQGDPNAASQLLPLVYDELRQLAAQKLAHEKPGQTLSATALVHEAYLRLVGGGEDPHWNSRGHFFAAAAEAMRRFLVENARRKKSDKRGGDRQRQDLHAQELAIPEVREDLLALDEALTRLAALQPQVAQLVQLRYFAGLSIPDAAKALGVSPRSADRLWAYARAWLHQEIVGDPPEDDSGNQ
jgi:RNA polymerase sigma factor (TIGR02999 family)